jgi:hypothetical protein
VPRSLRDSSLITQERGIEANISTRHKTSPRTKRQEEKQPWNQKRLRTQNVSGLELPPVSIEHGAIVAQRNRLRLGQSVAANGAAEANRNVVVDQLATAVGEDRRAVGKACAVPLRVGC